MVPGFSTSRLFHDPFTNSPFSCMLTIKLLWRWSSTQVTSIQPEPSRARPPLGCLYGMYYLDTFFPPNSGNPYKLYDKFELYFPWRNGTIAM